MRAKHIICDFEGYKYNTFLAFPKFYRAHLGEICGLKNRTQQETDSQTLTNPATKFPPTVLILNIGATSCSCGPGNGNSDPKSPVFSFQLS